LYPVLGAVNRFTVSPVPLAWQRRAEWLEASPRDAEVLLVTSNREGGDAAVSGIVTTTLS
jgi:hypothetical protein